MRAAGEGVPLSDELERWLGEAGGGEAGGGEAGGGEAGVGEAGGGETRVREAGAGEAGSGPARTLGSLIDAFGDKSFAVLLLLLLAVPALPLPTGGLTHVFELIAALVSLELIAGRREVWLPQRWRAVEIAGSRQRRFIAGLMRLIRRLERYSRPRLRSVFDRRVTHIGYGLLALLGTAGAFLAPPFSGLDTLPALGVVVLSAGVLLQDVLVALLGVALGVAGVVLELVLGAAAFHGISSIV